MNDLSFRDLGVAEVLAFGALAVVVVALLVALLVVIPRQAARRGHGFWSWFVLQLVGMNPIYPMILVAVLPNKARMRLRDEYAAALDDELRDAGRPVPQGGVGAAIERSIGDAATMDGIERSLGELPTAGGTIQRSMGDLPTRE